MLLRSKLLLFSILCASLLPVEDATAAPTGPVPPEARKHFDEGAKAYKLGEFARAVDEYRKSYELYPAALLLFDLGQAYRKLGQNEKALFTYQQYLTEAPTGRFRRVAEEMVTTLEDLVKRQRAAQQQPPADAPAREPAPVAQAPVLEPAPKIAPAPSATANLVVAPQPVKTEDKPPSRKGLWIGLGVAAGVVVAAGLGVGLGVGLGNHTGAPDSTLGNMPVS